MTNGLSDDESALVEAKAQHAMEQLAGEGIYVPFQTCVMAVELALYTQEVDELTEKIEALVAASRSKLEPQENPLFVPSKESENGNTDVLSCF